MQSYFFEDCNSEGTSLENIPKKFIKMFLFYNKIGLIKLPSIVKVMENQDFKCIYLVTMILWLQTY